MYGAEGGMCVLLHAHVLWGNNIIKSQLVSLQIFIEVFLCAVLGTRDIVMR